MQCSTRHMELDEHGEGLCSVPMWMYPGLPAGFCDEPAWGEPIRETGVTHVPGLACPNHGGPERHEAKL
jgi:hypothetical protein